MRRFCVVSILIASLIYCKPKERPPAEALPPIENNEYVDHRNAEMNESFLLGELKTSDSCPIKIISVKVQTQYTEPKVTIKLKNESGKAIDAIKLGFYCFNKFDERATNHFPGDGFRSNYRGEILQRPFTSGTTEMFSFSAYEGTTSVKAFIRQIFFTEVSIWDYEDYKPKD